MASRTARDYSLVLICVAVIGCSDQGAGAGSATSASAESGGDVFSGGSAISGGASAALSGAGNAGQVTGGAAGIANRAEHSLTAGAGGAGSSGASYLGCERAPLTEHVTFENPDDGSDGLSPFEAEVGGGNRIGAATAGPQAAQGLRNGYIEWSESNYANSRLTRGVEGRGQRLIGEVWCSYLLNSPLRAGSGTSRRNRTT